MKNLSDLTPTLADVRTWLLDEACLKVQKLAWKKIHEENKPPEDLIFFCIDLQTHWHVLAQLLDKDEVARAMQVPKAVTFIVGHTDVSFYEFLSCINLDPEDIRFVQETTPTLGRVKYLVFDEQGIDIREVLPKNQSGLQ